MRASLFGLLLLVCVPGLAQLHSTYDQEAPGAAATGPFELFGGEWRISGLGFGNGVGPGYGRHDRVSAGISDSREQGGEFQSRRIGSCREWQSGEF